MSNKLTRRGFGCDMGVLALAGGFVVPMTAAQAEAKDAEAKDQGADARWACNFQASYMTWDSPHRDDPRPYARHNVPHGNRARIQLEALIDVIDESAGTREQFVLIAPCRTEWVYAEDRLFQLPSAEYRNIYSKTQQRSMSKSLTADDNRVRTGRPVSGLFRSLKIELKRFQQTRMLESAAKIVKATSANVPLVARTEIRHPRRRLRYVLEYPIKTMNFQPKTDSFQVDTGPILVPDFKSSAPAAIDTLQMAHVAYNRLDRAEFIVRRPTAVTDKTGRELCRVLHYSEVREETAHNQIMGGLEA